MEYFGQAPLQARPTAPTPVLGASSLNEVPIYDFTSSGNDAANFRAVWGALNDVVMGGSSEGAGSIVTIPEEDGGTCARLGGVVEGQSGGFVSMRTRNFESPLDLSQYDGVRLKIRGDGNRFKLILHDEDDWWGSIAFHAAFDTVEGAWLTVDVPFASFRAVRRGEAGGVARSPNPEDDVGAIDAADAVQVYVRDGGSEPVVRVRAVLPGGVEGVGVQRGRGGDAMRGRRRKPTRFFASCLGSTSLCLHDSHGSGVRGDTTSGNSRRKASCTHDKRTRT